MSNAEHLANVMVEAFIAAVEKGVDLVPVVADSTSTAKIAPLLSSSPDGWLTSVSPSRAWSAPPLGWRSAVKWR